MPKHRQTANEEFEPSDRLGDEKIAAALESEQMAAFLTFGSWLRDQRHRADRVGDLARDWFTDHERPRGPITYAAMERRLEDCCAVDGAFRALEDAIGEWSRGSGSKGGAARG